MRRLALSLCCLSVLALPAAASAADFNPAPGTYTADTSTMRITGPGGTDITGADQGGVATFSFGTVNIGSGVTLTVQGSRPFKLAALGNLTVAGIINGNGTSASNFGPVANAGGPGGGAGGTQNPSAGSGPGGGGAGSATNHGGAGGGFGGTGARGGVSSGVAGTGGTAGPTYGNDVTVQGGSGGGGGAGTGGGGGGGAIALFGKVVTISDTGQVHVDGGNGAVGAGGASGGGSGGGIFVHANVIDHRGQLTAVGGNGGAGGCCGDGGGGGGGRIAFASTSFSGAGTTTVTGGTSGVAFTSGSFSHGGVSPDATGAVGVVSKVAGTRLITFDDAVAPDPDAAPCCFGSTHPLTERYASQGLHFAGGGAILNQSGGFGVTGQSAPNFLAFNIGVNYGDGHPAAGPETITFDAPISTATIDAGQGAGGTATVTAFRGSQVVGSAFRTATTTLAPLTVNGEHITKLELSFTGTQIVFDNLRWNTEPVSNGDSFSVGQNGTLNAGGLLANDGDADGDPLSAVLGSGPAHGAVSVRPDGGFTYTPAAGFSGPDSFTYHATDGAGSSRDSTVSIAVTPAPAPPTPTPTKGVPSVTSIKSRAFPKYTTLLALAAKRLKPGSKVVVTCKTLKTKQQKKGCPYKKKTFKTARAKATLDLRKPFRNRKLPVGTKIGITITAPGFLGKRITYTVRARKAPKSTIQCLSASGKAGTCR
jgi:hypothetical protein